MNAPTVIRCSKCGRTSCITREFVELEDGTELTIYRGCKPMPKLEFRGSATSGIFSVKGGE